MSMEPNPFSLCGRTILVTGGSSGIGRAVAIGAARMGARIAVLGRTGFRKPFRCWRGPATSDMFPT